jgi:hypothetical protein
MMGEEATVLPTDLPPPCEATNSLGCVSNGLSSRAFHSARYGNRDYLQPK